jgi:succinate dehydrogenase / fumarate reductase iron-sulfur subunit
VPIKYDVKSGFYTERVSLPVLVSRAAGALICFSATCPHLGCTVRWDGNSSRFRCACHGGTFDRDGTVLAGPPPRPLDRYPFKIDSGQLLVEVG